MAGECGAGGMDSMRGARCVPFLPSNIGLADAAGAAAGALPRAAASACPLPSRCRPCGRAEPSRGIGGIGPGPARAPPSPRAARPPGRIGRAGSAHRRRGKAAEAAAILSQAGANEAPPGAPDRSAAGAGLKRDGIAFG